MEEEKMFELLTSVKNMVKTDPTQARAALTSHPNLAYALMKEMVALDVVEPEVLTRTLQAAATGAQPPQNQATLPQQQQQQQQQQAYPPPSNGTPSYPSYPAPGSAPAYGTPQPGPYQQPPPSSTPSYSTPYPSTSTPTYPPAPVPSYPPVSTPSYPSSYPPQPPQNHSQPPSMPPQAYQARQQQQQQQQPPVQSRAPASAPPGMGSVPGLAPEQQAMVQRLALLTPDQIAALPPSDRVALIELRRQLGLE
ncbi:hypothetical protein RHS04_01154 [Rhizoctonia solani]|uniref:Cleavage stimulation factor subunit 2 hinge domain-containing protein n=1 Tax=Rhizoctonia solani TaxID=456999 RepID=A0A8H7HEQ8_9AGAM|nr:hypothetical protein RHS04_01154 [Rhizoctonia solani]